MSSTPSSDAAEGPVLTLITKRLRALKKKLKRISQLEEALASGTKTLNDEQKDVIKTKPAIGAAIDELQKLRPAISVAVDEEVALAANTRNNECQKQNIPESDPVEDLLNLIYFGATFDLIKQNDFTMMMLTRAHERQSYLSYGTMLHESDVVSDDTLCEKDLDLVAKLGNLLISRPADSILSHKNSLQQCFQHAKQWLAKSDLPIDSASNITYAELRAKLNKITASDYFTAAPEIKATVDIAAAENYSTFHVPVGTILVPSEVDSSAMQFQQKGEEPAVYQENGTYDSPSSYLEEAPAPKVESQTENLTEDDISQTNVNHSQADEQNNGDFEWKEKTKNGSRRSFRGGRGGGRRGFLNERGARGSSRGGRPYYPNGHSEYYENGNFYPRSYHNSRGRGGNVDSNHGSRAQGVYTDRMVT